MPSPARSVSGSEKGADAQFPPLPPDFYRRDNVVEVARDLLGMVLVTRLPRGENDSRRVLCAGRITEVEAYAAPGDRASHAFNNRRTQRTETMFAEGGVAYIYLCYGIHCLFNVVTGPRDLPHAVLVRSIEPVDGLESMLARHNRKTFAPGFTAGPGRATRALGLDLRCNGLRLDGGRVRIENRGGRLAPQEIIAAPRVGVDYAGPDARRPWRFLVKNSPWVSKPPGAKKKPTG